MNEPIRKCPECGGAQVLVTSTGNGIEANGAFCFVCGYIVPLKRDRACERTLALVDEIMADDPDWDE